MTRCATVLAGVMFVSLCFVTGAGAKVYFNGIPAAAAPGTAVNAFVAGCQAAPSCGPLVRGVPVYLTRVQPGPMNYRSLPKPRWLLGKATAAGKLRFTIPPVAPGSYRLIARVIIGESVVPQYLPASRVFAVRPA